MKEAKQKEHLHRSAHSRLPRTLRILLVGGSLLLALLTNLSFLFKVSSIAAAMRGSWLYVFPLDQPEFWEEFWQSVRSYTWPPHRIYYLGSIHAWTFIIVVGLVGWYWYSAIRTRENPVIFLSPALAPALVGLALAPLTVRNIVAIAEQGLKNPAAAGDFVGLAATTVFVGILLSLICMLAMLRSRPRSDSGPERL